MKFSDSLKLALQNLWRTRFRSFLTVLGVIIGISAIVLFVSLGVGLQKITSDQIASVNSLNTLTVSQMPATASMEEGPAITENSVQKVTAISGVKEVSPSVTLPANIICEGTSAGGIVNGVKIEKMPIEVSGLDFGAMPKTDSEAVVSSMLAGSFVPNKENIVGKDIEIEVISNAGGLEFKAEKIKFTVTGVDSNNATNMVYAPLDKIYQAGSFDRFSTLKVIVKSTKQINSIEKEVKDLGYQTTTIKDLIDQIDKIFLLVQIILGIVAGIGLLVSSLGIINTMTISLLERTREIGIMKAIGASNRDIKRMFYLETALIGLIGGLSGVGLAYGTGKFFNYAINLFLSGNSTYLTLFITPVKFAAIMVTFAILLALFAGIYPASRAKKLSPMMAIRQ